MNQNPMPMPMMQPKPSHKSHGGLIAIILLSLGLICAIGLSVWLYMQYSEQKSNVDAKVAAATAEAVKVARDEEATKYRRTLNSTLETFKGPSDYGSLSFTFPKYWSVYVADDTSQGGDFRAYLNPKVVPPTELGLQRFGMRVLIENKTYDEVVASYDDLVEDNSLEPSAVKAANGERGTRFDGKFEDGIRGSVVLFKVRDKTISVFTDADTFKNVYEKSIKTIRFSV